VYDTDGSDGHNVTVVPSSPPPISNSHVGNMSIAFACTTGDAVVVDEITFTSLADKPADRGDRRCNMNEDVVAGYVTVVPPRLWSL
jgi:hypothetical protein